MSRDDEFIDGVQILHDLNNDAETIARKLHASVGDVRAVLRTGSVPPRQRLLQWTGI